MTIKQDYKVIAQGKREQRDSLIPSEWRVKTPSDSQNVLQSGLLSEKELKITSDHDAVDILERIKTRQYSAEEVTRAFCKRAAIAQQLTNCLTEIFFDEAIERSKKLDEELAGNPDQHLRPLHGLPISIKDSFRVPGVDSTTGLVCWANEPDTEFSSLPKLLLDLGAVLYCKTNVPQTMMTADSDNNVFGRTLNPNNLSLTAGGSSGGEGALIALRGSILGVGTDIAGSIRIPSICCVRRNLAESARKLEAAGIEVIPISLPDVGEAVETIMRMFSLDGCKFIQNLIASGGEPEVPSVRNINLAGIPAASLEDFFKLNAARSRI
ncbi:hypothetical protein PRZ48_010695 [Zasmidium cellare]|uniref:amidase n=1 Tax=Zasmidium cellare TaxID=395010 RepID=A0ABR0E9C9_ZASCE|nr:hypothetical protein PRZ48_010695 [Zasmidium cellare]